VEERVEDITDLFPGMHEDVRPGYFVERVEAAANPNYERLVTMIVRDAQRFLDNRRALWEAIERVRADPSDDNARQQANRLYNAFSGQIAGYETFIMPKGSYKQGFMYHQIGASDLDLIAAMGHAAS
jgi:hypothetical protein